MFIRCNLMCHQCNYHVLCLCNHDVNKCHHNMRQCNQCATNVRPMHDQCTTNVTNVDQLKCSSCQRLRVTTWEHIQCLCDSNCCIAYIETGNLYIRTFSPEESKIGRNCPNSSIIRKIRIVHKQPSDSVVGLVGFGKWCGRKI